MKHLLFTLLLLLKISFLDLYCQEKYVTDSLSLQSKNDTLKAKEERSKNHFFLFGHKDNTKGVENLHARKINDSTSYFARYKDSLISHKLHFNHLKKYQSGLYELNVENANTRNVLYDIQKATGVHISIIGELPPKISTHLSGFNLEYILDELSYENGWVFVNQLNHYIIYAQKADEILGNKPIIYQYFPQNVKAEDLKDKVKDYLSDDVTVKLLPNQNTIVISGKINDIYKSISFLRMFDKAPKTISIELLVVEYIHGKSFNWDFNVTSGSYQRISDANYSPQSGVNFSYSFLSALDPNFKVNLSALVENEFANIVTNPHVVTENNKEATIKLTDSRYIQLQTATINGVTVNLEKIDVGIELKVTPAIMSNELIELILYAKNSFFLPQESEQQIATSDNTINTQVMIKNGETLILGGLVQSEESAGKGGVPFLRNIPIIGLLFSKISNRKNYSEIVIYITPYIDPIISSKGYHSMKKVNEINEDLEKEGKKLENKGIRKLFKK